VPAEQPPESSSGRDLPEVSQTEARRLVVSLGCFWAGFALVEPVFDSVLGAVLFLPAFAAGWVFFLTLFRIWDQPLFLWPGRGYFGSYWRQNRVMFSVFRPAFIRRVFTATRWPSWLVGGALIAALGAALTSLAAFSPSR
jgi:hypothetical protein